MNVLILMVAHLNKRTDGNAQQRIGGSTAWTAAPRAAFVAIKNTQTGERMLLPAKNNLGSDQIGFNYEIRERLQVYADVSVKAPYVHWLGKTTTDIEQMLNPPKTQGKASLSAEQFLTDQLSNNEKILVESLKEAAEIQGITWSSIERVKQQMPVISEKIGRQWVWSISEEAPK